jgi:outer membrane protein OmpA-like peptidoglycan-associated protein
MKYATLLITIILTTLSYSQTTAPIKVIVTDFSSKHLAGEKIQFVNQVTKQTISGVSNAKGLFKVNLPAGTYDIKMKSIGDAQDYSSVEIPKIGANQTYTEMTVTIQMSLPKFFTLDNLHFSSGQATILKSSYKELAELVEYLTLKPNLKIEIAGHTDSDGEESSNLELSIKRALAIKNYLIKKGIKANRLFHKGYGESMPVADNSTKSGKAKNRRTEIRVL